MSFLSPCVLPLVPAYLGQLTAVAVAAQGPCATPSRWAALRHALAFVAGFGTVFTLLGVTAAFAGGEIAAYMQTLRVIGGAILVIMGMSRLNPDGLPSPVRIDERHVAHGLIPRV